MNKTVSSLFAAAILALAVGHSAKALTLSPPTVEINAKPGEVVQVVAKLYNDTASVLDIKPGALSFTSKGERGQPDFFEDKTGLDLQHWITVPSDVALAPQERRSVVIAVAVPKNADPGGHYAAIFWGTQPPKVENSGAGIQGQIAMLILVNVEGNAKADASIIEFRPVSKFVTHLPADFIVRVQNTGSVHVHPAGDLMIRNMFGRRAVTLPFNIQPSTGNVLPKSIRRFDLSWFKQGVELGQSEWYKEWNNFAFGRYTAELAATYGPSNKLFTAKTTFWVFPWMVCIVMLIGLALVVFILRSLVMRYNRYIVKKFSQNRSRK